MFFMWNVCLYCDTEFQGVRQPQGLSWQWNKLCQFFANISESSDGPFKVQSQTEIGFSFVISVWIFHRWHRQCLWSKTCYSTGQVPSLAGFKLFLKNSPEFAAEFSYTLLHSHDVSCKSGPKMGKPMKENPEKKRFFEMEIGIIWKVKDSLNWKKKILKTSLNFWLLLSVCTLKTQERLLVLVEEIHKRFHSYCNHLGVRSMTQNIRFWHLTCIWPTVKNRINLNNWNSKLEALWRWDTYGSSKVS